MTNISHLEYLEIVAAGDVKHLREKEKTYQGSWKKRGGVGAFMMLARKWDRIENMLSAHTGNPERYDIFNHISHPLPLAASGADGTVLAEVRDMRRYLMLVEAEMMARGVVKTELTSRLETDEHSALGLATPEDGGQHESVWPWITKTERFGDFQERSLTTGDYRLVDHVSLPIPADHYSHVRHLYDKLEDGLVLKIELCPASVRGSYSSYPLELNSAELTNLALPTWFKNYLYGWQESSGKYVLRRTAFHDENR